jgi:hypothetical protein
MVIVLPSLGASQNLFSIWRYLLDFQFFNVFVFWDFFLLIEFLKISKFPLLCGLDFKSLLQYGFEVLGFRVLLILLRLLRFLDNLLLFYEFDLARIWGWRKTLRWWAAISRLRGQIHCWLHGCNSSCTKLYNFAESKIFRRLTRNRLR